MWSCSDAATGTFQIHIHCMQTNGRQWDDHGGGDDDDDDNGRDLKKV